MITTRREFLEAAAVMVATPTALSAASPVLSSASRWSAGRTYEPGLQLYTLGLKGDTDFAPALKEVAAIGYREVELPEHYGRTAADLRSVLDAAGLTCPAIHVAPRPSPRSWDLTGDLSKVIADMRVLGARYAVASIPYMPDRIYQVLQHPPNGFNAEAVGRLFASLTAEDWKRSAEMLNTQGAELASAGFRLAYHNHGIDFFPLPGSSYGYELIAQLTDPHYVDFELDIGWAAAAGQKVGDVFSLVAKRVRLLHLKDTKRKGHHPHDLASTDLGTGIINWQEVKQLIRDSHIEHLFVEQETPFATTPLDAARVDYQFLTKLFSGGAA